MNVLITGINGFVGQALARACVKRGWGVHGAARSFENGNAPPAGGAVRLFHTSDIGHITDWREALMGVDVVVHLAARVHVMADLSVDPWAEFKRVNVAGTLSLAKQALDAGVRRLVYLSTIKVNGELTGGGGSECFFEVDVVSPQDLYSLSKWEAEQELWALSREGLEVVVIRSPLVYGPGVKANFLRLLRLVSRGCPLPLGSVNNRRSMIYLDNLVDFIISCAVQSAAAGELFLVSDGDDLSTPSLIRLVAMHMSRSSHLLYCPLNILRIGAWFFGKRGEFERLCGSLQVDIGKAERCLGWTPPFSVDFGMRKTVEWYMSERGAVGHM